ncbi:hypothetical protein [Senegalia massiliensis]|uniref:hypothetical protein n=1 Tax=Senegalia massiliensis TaxID=1720316 RepID=UPI0010307559|nr:hypothetical protein [Senegalia massiliensis]
MTKYLWQLNLDDIPLGWEQIYKEAIKEYPHGEIFSFENLNYDDTNRYFYHPVKYRDEIYRLFNKYKIEAKYLFDSKDKYNFKTFTTKIVKLDSILYNLLFYWTQEEKEVDGSCFDPRDLEEDIYSFESYFDFDDFESQFQKTYNKYKIINL